MGKWLAIAALALLVVLVVLWKQLDGATAAPSTASPSPRVAAPAAPRPPGPPPAAPPVAVDATPDPTPGAPTKIDPASDQFFDRFSEAVPKRLTSNAARCYEGVGTRLHRNQSVVFQMKIRVKDGVVTVHDVVVERSTLASPGLESCFQQEVGRTTWTDPELPDWETSQQLTISPERGMKKFLRESRDYRPRD